MRAMGQNPTIIEIESIMKKLDKDKNGTIELPEFIDMMHHNPVIDVSQKERYLVEYFKSIFIIFC